MMNLNRRQLLGGAMAALATARTARGAQASGYAVPAEEAPHARTWMCWASAPSIYGVSTAYFEDVQTTLGRLAAAIAEHEPVAMAVGAEQHALAAELCGPKVTLVDIPTDDMWARDSGPVFVSGPDGVALVDFNFNGWGGKQRHAIDRGVPAAIAAHPQVAAIAFGGADLAADLHAELAWEPMLWARSRIVQAAASRGLPAFDVPFLNIHDGDGLRAEALASKRLGYSCKLAIHPAQVAPIKGVFAPTPDELARARKIVEAYDAANGAACQVDGKMVDVPVWKAALRTVRLAATE